MQLDKTTIVGASLLFVVLILSMFAYSYYTQRQVPVVAPVVETEENIAPLKISRVDAKHFYVDGVHVVLGELLMPTPCDLVDVVAEVKDDSVTLLFTVINSADTCVQVVTPQRFKVRFEAPQDVRITATYDGVNIPLNLIPSRDGENPDDFELFIKG